MRATNVVLDEAKVVQHHCCIISTYEVVYSKTPSKVCGTVVDKYQGGVWKNMHLLTIKIIRHTMIIMGVLLTS